MTRPVGLVEPDCLRQKLPYFVAERLCHTQLVIKLRLFQQEKDGLGLSKAVASILDFLGDRRLGLSFHGHR